MLYNLMIDDGKNMVGAYLLAMMLTGFVLTFCCLKFLKRILPKDQGRAFAVNGELSEGKARGAGLLFITTFTLSVALFVPLKVESILYLVFIYAGMLSGYFDDAAEKPWGNVKKGLIDFVIAVGTSFTYYHFNDSVINIKLFNIEGLKLNPVLFVILGAVLVWTAINVTNCTDGVDGLCASLVMTVLPFASILAVSQFSKLSSVIMFAVLCAYFWYNCSPSTILMGDAGSRALGVFLAVLFLESKSPLAFIVFSIVIILDGGLGLLKLSFRRFLKIKNFMEGIRTPLHDHARKNKNWSDTQVVMRFVIIQMLVSICYFMIVFFR